MKTDARMNALLFHISASLALRLVPYVRFFMLVTMSQEMHQG